MKIHAVPEERFHADNRWERETERERDSWTYI